MDAHISYKIGYTKFRIFFWRCYFPGFCAQSGYFLKLVFSFQVVAFLVALNQNKQLIGSNGLLPIPNFFKMVKNHFGAQFRLASFQAVPTLLWAVNPENIDFYLDLVAYAGILISLFILYFGCANMFMMLTLWILYHSLVNIGQRWLVIYVIAR